MGKKTIACKMSPNLINKIDKVIKKRGFKNRSEVLREATKSYIQDLKTREENIEKLKKEINEIERKARQKKEDLQELKKRDELVKERKEGIMEEFKQWLYRYCVDNDCYIWKDNVGYVIGEIIENETNFNIVNYERAKNIALNIKRSELKNKYAENMIEAWDKANLIDFESMI